MTKSTITTMPDPHGFSPGPLTEMLRADARDLIQQAVEAELSVLLVAHSKAFRLYFGTSSITFRVRPKGEAANK